MLKSLSHRNHTHNQNVVTLKLLFLVSALNSEGRKTITEEFDGRKSILDFLQHVLDNSSTVEYVDFLNCHFVCTWPYRAFVTNI